MKKEVVISGIVCFVIGALFITYVPLDGGAGFQGKMTKITAESESKYDLPEEENSSVKDKMEGAETMSKDEISKNIVIDEDILSGNNNTLTPECRAALDEMMRCFDSDSANYAAYCYEQKRQKYVDLGCPI